MTSTLTILAFDFGTQNIGVAVGQTFTHSTQSLTPIKANDGIPNWDTIKALLDEWLPDLLVVGIPLNMDGTESDMSMRARKFGKRLHGRFGLKVEEIDERLSTREAKERAAMQGHKGNYKRKPIDSVAAQVILEDWFENH